MHVRAMYDPFAIAKSIPVPVPHPCLSRRAARWMARQDSSRALATDAAGELDILGQDGYTLGMNSTEVGVLEQTHKVGLGGLL